jgi:crossover junction endodeoxyribonuclease RusA
MSRRTWTLVHHERPISLNAERTKPWQVRAASTKEWRTAFFWLAKQAHIPALERIKVEVRVSLRGRLQDPVNCYPSVKAAIDGLVLAGVIPDDTPAHVHSVTFHAPIRGDDCLRLVVRSLDS